MKKLSIPTEQTKTAEVLDDIKAIGYKYSTRAAMTVSISDMTVPPQKPQMIEQAQETVDQNHQKLQTWSDHRRRALQRSCRDLEKTDDELTKAC